MAEWKGNARTNFVRVNDLESLGKSIKPFGVELYQHEYNQDYFCLCPKQIDGCGSFGSIFDEQTGNEIISASIDIDDIYKLAAEKFEMDIKDIARCDYNYLPENITKAAE